MAELIVAQAKEKEFDRLKDFVLNQMSLIEAGLNPQSVSRNPYGNRTIWVPLQSDIDKLYATLLELRENMLTFEERVLLETEVKLLNG